MRTFFLVLARDRKGVDEKIKELAHLGLPCLVICGERSDDPHVVYREPIGKFDALNFGAKLVAEDFDIVALNDVDTKIHNVKAGLKHFSSKDVALVFAKVSVREGPQKFFYVILDFIRKKVPIAASGELMLVRRKVLMDLLPVKPCKAEDTYVLYRILEAKHKVVFSEECYAETERTKSIEEEQVYKRRTVCGIYQALSYTRPPFLIKAFYTALPFASPFLLVLGKKGYFWMKGILLGLKDFMQGDRSGVWQTTYLD